MNYRDLPPAPDSENLPKSYYPHLSRVNPQRTMDYRLRRRRGMLLADTWDCKLFRVSLAAFEMSRLQADY